MEVDNIQHHSFIQQVLLTAYSVAGPVLSTENIAVNKTPPPKNNSCSHGIYIFKGAVGGGG